MEEQRGLVPTSCGWGGGTSCCEEKVLILAQECTVQLLTCDLSSPLRKIKISPQSLFPFLTLPLICLENKCAF
ncbi:hypothetical protein J4Q44_G00166580 [Coregonus suidteri]|uniref:Uncharacterized protein n=1 Tax=Coregonus suidteri TaxID=861788 RepID=A0AAN8QVU5_9TELE